MNKADRNRKLIEALKQFDILAVERLLADPVGHEDDLSDKPISIFKGKEQRYEPYLLIRGRSKPYPVPEPFVIALVDKSEDAPSAEPIIMPLVSKSEQGPCLRVLRTLKEPSGRLLAACEILVTSSTYTYRGIYTSHSTSARYEGREKGVFTRPPTPPNRKLMRLVPLDGAPELSEGELLTRTEIVED